MGSERHVRIGQLALTLIAIALVVGVMGASSRTMQSFHGLNYIAYIYQVLNGNLPLMHAGSFGSPVDLYWAWYVLLAGAMRLFNTGPLQIFVAHNALMLVVTLLVLHSLVRTRVTVPLWQIALPFLPFFLLNPLGQSWFVLRQLAGYRPRLDSPNHMELLLFTSGHPAAPGPRLATFAAKFLNANGFVIGVALFVCLIWLIDSAGEDGRWRLLGAFAIGLLISLLHPTSAVGAVLLLLAFGCANLWHWWRSARTIKQLLVDNQLIIAVGVGMACALPYLIPLLTGGPQLTVEIPPALTELVEQTVPANTSVAAPRGFVQRLTDNMLSKTRAALPSLLIVVLVLAAERQRLLQPAARRQLTLLLGVLLLWGGAMLLPIPDGNQYKFNHLMTLLAMLLFADWLGRRTQLRAWSVALVVAGIIGLLAPTLVYRQSAWAQENRWQNVGTRLVSADATRQEGIDWVLASTSDEMLLLGAPPDVNQPELSALMQRQMVAWRASNFTRHIKHQPQLATAAQQIVERLAACDLAVDELNLLFDMTLPWPETVLGVAESAEGVPLPTVAQCDLPAGVTVVFDNEAMRIFRIER